MADNFDKYGLDLHCNMILEEYSENQPVFSRMKDIVTGTLSGCLAENNILVTALEARIKTEKSLAGKLELKGGKYRSLSDMTDILGARVITFYSDDVDKISAIIEKTFEVDWANSVDKRKMHELDSFGYSSLHFICRIPRGLYCDPATPLLNEYRFEIQMRTALQHVWANMYHDTGYKSGVEIPKEYIRSLNRLAGMLELADDEFSRIRNEITDYRRKVQALVSDGRFEEVPLNGDTFRSYLQLGPFDKLNKRIAAINQAEIHPTSLLLYLNLFKELGFHTLGDVHKLVRDYSDAAFQLAVSQLGGTDIDIISSSVSVQNLCIVYILLHGGGEKGLELFFNGLYGKSTYNKERSMRIYEQALSLAFMNQK